jgi:mRNA deadenylase 3'-5' endonuclease subunit Ccr4
MTSVSENYKKEEECNEKISFLPLRIVSYNILADCYVRVPDQPWNAFSYCEEEYLLFSNRCPRIVQNLLQSNADIIVLQEVMFEFRDDLWQLPEYLVHPLLDAGYVPVMQGLKQKEIAKNALRNDRMVKRAVPTGLGIFWKHERFTEFESGKHSSGGGMTVFLQPRESSMVLSLNNIHLVGDPQKFDQHLNQLNGAMKQILNKNLEEALKQKSISCVYDFICGDLNGDVVVPSANGDTERTIVGQWFIDNCFLRAPTGLTWSNDTSWSRLDHLMFRRRESMQCDTEAINDNTCTLLPHMIECCKCLPPDVSKRDIESLGGGIPNQYHPSDHVMLQVDFKLGHNLE